MGRAPGGPFPRGWFQVAYADELAPGAAVPLRCLGRDLVLFRAGGAPRVLDAHCPHQGAHLGYGGRIEGACLRCPFHGWRFSAEGACVEIPRGGADPARARLRSWPCAERNGLILLHHGAAGVAAPSGVPALPEFGSPGWTPYERRSWRIKTDLLTPLENIVDPVHFELLHGHPGASRTAVTAQGPVIRARSTARMRAPGGGLVEGTIDWEGFGLGYGVMRISGLVETTIVICPTPVEEGLLDLRFSFTTRRGGPPGLGEAVVRDVLRQIEEDLPIWEHRVRLERPLLTVEDRGILALRRWAGQFYRKGI